MLFKRFTIFTIATDYAWRRAKRSIATSRRLLQSEFTAPSVIQPEGDAGLMR